jgi:hypothetical protein
MIPKKTGGAPPPPAVYALGKRKQRATVAIKSIETLLREELEGHPDIIKALAVLKGYRKGLDEA